MITFLKKVITLGTEDTIIESKKKYIVLTNGLTLFFSFFTLGFTSFFCIFLPDSLPLLILGFIGSLAFWIPFFFNINNKFISAKLGNAIVAALFLPLVSIMVGRDMLVHLFLLISILIPFIIYSPEEKLFMYLHILIMVGTFFLVEFTNFQVPYPVPVPIDLKYFVRGSILFGLIFFIFSISLYNYLTLRKSEADLENEKQKSDELLLNILPESIANELKTRGHSDPVSYNDVFILFTDFVSFTSHAEKLDPQELICKLDYYFSQFDGITKKYCLEKIKTIGDSYMIAAGLADSKKTYHVDCILAALEIADFITNEKHKVPADSWDIRIGIHTGSISAGIVGKIKFSYDIFGSSVNLANRMETLAEVGKINISQSTYDLIKDYFKCEFREKIHVQNIGDINMFQVNGLHPKYTDNSQRLIPNDLFWQDVHNKPID